MMQLLLGFFMVGIGWRLIVAPLVNRHAAITPIIDRWQHFCLRVRRLVIAYLLMHIGFVGGVAITQQGWQHLPTQGALSIGLGLTCFGLAWVLLQRLGIVDTATRVSLAAHYGSVSIGTFAVAHSFLLSQGVEVDPAVAAWLALMEIPAILLGAAIIDGAKRSLLSLFREQTTVILIGALISGMLCGPAALKMLEDILVRPFDLILLYFLFDMGQEAGDHLVTLRQRGWQLIGFGIFMPITAALLSGIIGSYAYISGGNLVMLMTMCASASYVSATATMNSRVSKQALALSLTAVLGVTLPWNVLVGIRLYYLLAPGIEWMVQQHSWLVLGSLGALCLIYVVALLIRSPWYIAGRIRSVTHEERSYVGTRQLSQAARHQFPQSSSD